MQAEMTVFESVIDGFDDAVEHLKARHASASRPDAGPGRVICGASRIRTMSPTAWRTWSCRTPAVRATRCARAFGSWRAGLADPYGDVARRARPRQNPGPCGLFDFFCLARPPPRVS